MHTKVIQMFKVTNFKLSGPQLIIDVAKEDDEIQVSVERYRFENWLTGGTGKISFCYDIQTASGDWTQSVEVYNLGEYWRFATNINNAPALQDITAFIYCDNTLQDLIQTQFSSNPFN